MLNFFTVDFFLLELKVDSDLFVFSGDVFRYRVPIIPLQIVLDLLEYFIALACSFLLKLKIHLCFLRLFVLGSFENALWSYFWLGVLGHAGLR